MTPTTDIAVIGAGAWGTALANLLAKKGLRVRLWVHEADLADRIRRQRENDLYLAGIPLAPGLAATASLEEAVSGSPVVLLVPPSQVLRGLVVRLVPHLGPGTLVISAAKGIENGSLQLMSEVLAETLPADRGLRTAYLSGPSFALEVARELPTAVVAAADDPAAALTAQQLFGTDYFRVYTHDDPIGTEVGGAMKNVIALAAGIGDGLGLGHNSRAALITRGLAEISRLGVALGARPATFAGLAGLGDLVLTCTGALSRNYSLGVELGQGRALRDILAARRTVAEGVTTTLSAFGRAARLGVEMPITEQAHAVLYHGKDCRVAVTDLMLRQPRPENG